MKEIEIAYVLEDSIKEAQKKLEGLKFVGKSTVKDTYFYDPSKKSSKPFRNNMGECLRIRTTDNEHTVEYKIDKFDEDGHWEASDKYGTKVEDLRTTLENFNNSNLKELVSLEKVVYTYTTDEYIITLEEVKNLGNFFEINYNKEIKDEVSTIKDAMSEYVESLNIKLGDTLKMGKPEMMLKKLGIHVK